MEGYFGNNSNFNRNIPPLNPSNDNISLFASPRDYDSVARARHYDESVMLRYLLSSSSSSDEYTTPRNPPAPIGSDRLRRLSSSSSGGCLTPRRSPLSPLENLENSPSRRSELASKAVKIEEDVLVMDEVPVRSVVRAGGGNRSGRMKSPLCLSSDSGSLQSSPPVTSYGGLHKRELCRSWEDFGACRYGTKCMFAHGKEEIDPRILSMTRSEMVHSKEEIDPRIISKIKSEFAHSKEEIDPRIICKPKSEFAHGKEQIDLRVIISKTKSEARILEPLSNHHTQNKPSPSISLLYGQKNTSADNAPTDSYLKEKGISLPYGDTMTRENSPSVEGQNWSPLDDGIQLKLPYPAKNPPSKEAVEEYFNRTLHGAWPSEKKRLPVFEEICPDASHSKSTLSFSRLCKVQFCVLIFCGGCLHH